MLTDTYNQKGEKMEKGTQLPKDIFGLEINDNLIYQVVVSQMANRRQNTAHSKDRGEKRGGGRKPWAQKGTGRARHGSNRSPIWIGGGVTFGPRKERNYKKRIPKKMRRKSLFMALSAKARNNQLIILKDLKIKEAKTREMKEILNKLPASGKRLIVLPEYDKNIILASRNIPKLSVISARNLSTLDVLSFKYLLMPKKSLRIIKETFSL